MRTRREYRIVDSKPSEVVKYLEEWLLAYEFRIERRGGWTKKHLEGKTILRGGSVGIDLVSGGDILEVFFKFEASKIPSGTNLIGEYYAHARGGKREWNLITLEDSLGHANLELRYLLELAKSYVGSFEKYFSLQEGKASEWHDENLDFSRMDNRIVQVLTFEAKDLRKIAQELNIHRIGDIRKLQHKLVDLSRSRPNVIGGWYGFRVSGGHTGRALILEGSFWRRDITQ